MHLHFLDPYQHRTSLVHTLDARVKFILSVAFILTTSLTPLAAWPMYILLLAMLISVEILSGLGVGYVLKRSLLTLPFVLAALPVIFTRDGQALFSLPIGEWVLTASVEGLEQFISVVLKSWLSVQAAIVLVASTQFPMLLQAMRAVGIPRLLVGIFSLMWRYLFVLVDEAMRLMRARTARSGENPQAKRRPGGDLAWRARVTGGMAGSLFLRAYERSDRIYMAMLVRGYDGEIRSLPMAAIPFGSRIVLAAGLSILIIFILSGILLWG